MKFSWRQTVVPIATIFSFRLLGLFMLIPIFTLYASKLHNTTPLLTGIALGSYGLSQGILQIPFGLLSDRFGRKLLITIGLVLFAIGSLVGAFAHSIEMMIIARALQGAGAVGSVLMALLADLTPDESRTKAMAVVGISIGFSFSLAMIVSPIIAKHNGLAGVFYLTAVFALVGLVLLHLVIPTPIKDPFTKKPTTKEFISAFKNPHLQRLNLSIFFQHLMLTSTFYVLPLLLKTHISTGNLTESWHFYLPLMLGGFILMAPIITLAERKNSIKRVFLVSVLLTTLSQFILAWGNKNWAILCIMMLIYFVAFNILEALLPSQISRQADVSNKGTAMGIYSSSQFLGIFAGGALAGAAYQYFDHAEIIFFLNGIIGLIWGLATYSIRPNTYQLTYTLPLPQSYPDENTLTECLLKIPGVHSISIDKDQQLIHIRVLKDTYVKGSAESTLKNWTTKLPEYCV